MTAVTIELPAAHSRHVEANAFVDMFFTFDHFGSSLVDINDPPVLEGVMTHQDLEVTEVACDDELCALTLLMTSERAHELLALLARPDMHAYPWVRPRGEHGQLEMYRTTLKELLDELDLAQVAYDAFVEAGRTAADRRTISLEVDAPFHAMSRFEGGAFGELVGSFGTDKHDAMSITLLQRVQVDDVRAEGDRVVLELEVPESEATLLTVARREALRLDFVHTRRDAEHHETYRRSGGDVILNATVVDVGRPVRIRRRRRK